MNLEQKDLFLLDGGLATELERRGHDLDHPLWSARLLLENPGAIQEVHEAYLRAGADIITTSSYQASLPGLKREGLSREEAIEVLGRSVDLARRACRAANPDALVAASLGPCAASLADGSEYIGDYDKSFEELLAFHKEPLEILIKFSPEILAFETIPSKLEAEALAALLDGMEAPPVWISFQCRDESRIADGTPIGECAALLDSVDAVTAIGVNCTAPRLIPPLIKTLRSATSKPLVVYPNSGESYDARTRTWTGLTDPDAFASAAVRWHAAGASIIGGCCRTTPDFIRRLGSLLKT